MYRFLVAIIGLIALSASSALNAQSINFSSQSPDLEVCGAADTFSVTLNNSSPDTLFPVTILIDFPAGVNYLPGSVSGTGMGELNVSNTDSVFFASTAIPPFQVKTFTFLAEANCSAIDSTALANQIRVFHNRGVDNALSDPYNLIYPSLSVQQITPASFSGPVGSTFNRCISVINGGYGPLSNFTIALERDSLLLQYTNFILSANGSSLPFTLSGDSIIFSIGAAQIAALGDNDTIFERNEQIQICYDATILDCSNLQPQPHSVYWGCGGQTCQVSTVNADITVPVQVPNLTTSRIYQQSRCYGSNIPSVIKIIVTNNGSGPARDVLLDVWQGGPTGHSAGYMSTLDTASIQWANSMGGSQHLQPTLVRNGITSGNYGCIGANPIIRFNVRIPFIQPGETDTLIVDQYSCCKTWCSSSPTHIQRCYYQVDYNDECLSQNYAIQATNIKGYNYGRVISFTPAGPTDLSSGDTATYCFEHSNFNFYNTSPGAYFYTDMVLPPTLTYTAGAGDLYYEDIHGDRWNPTTISQIGDTVRAFFDFPRPGNFNMEKSNFKIKVTPNCSLGPCSSGPATMQFAIYQVADTNCTCVSTIACLNLSVNVHCGACNCTDGGIVFVDFDSRRWNYGLPDNDNNGIPDGAGAINMASVRTKHHMLGDTLYTRFAGIVDTTTANPLWTVGQASSTLTRGNVFTNVINSIRIFDFSTGNTFSCPLAAPGVNTTGTTRTFTYDFDTTLSCLPNGFVFEEGDSVIIENWYRMSANPGSIVQGQTISNTFSMINPTTSLVASCDNFSGDFVVVGYYYTSWGPNQLATDGCSGRNISENYYLSIGNCCSNYGGGNIFEDEYRHWGHLSQARVVIPSGYTYNTATINYRRTAGTQATALTSTPIVPVAIGAGPNGDTLIFDTEPLFAVNGGPFPMGDDGYHGTLTVNIIPGCGVTPDIGQPIFYIWDFSPIPELTGVGSVNPQRTRRDSIAYEAPALDLSAGQQIVSALDTTVTWDFLLENNSNSSDASNAWFAIISPSGQTGPFIVTDNNTSNTLTPVNGIFQAGNLLADSSRGFSIEAAYSNCNSDSILVIAGWDCGAFPANLGAVSCDPDTLILYLEPQPAEVQANLNVIGGPFDICDSVLVELQVVNSQLATVQDLRVIANLPVSGGLSYLGSSSSLQYPSLSSFDPVSDPTQVGNRLIWTIANIDSLINAKNFPGIVKPDSNSFTLRFYLETNCGFISGEQFFVRIRGNRICGDVLPPVTLISNPLQINGAVTPYNTQVIGASTPLTSCPDVQTIQVGVTNAGLGTTSTNDSIFVDLPAGYSYAGNFTSVFNAPPNTTPAQNSFLGGVRLGWELPTGTAPGDSIVFGFDIQIGQNVACGTTLLNVQTVVNSNLFCALTSSFCSSASQTGSNLISVPVDRPSLSFNSFSSSLAPTTGGYDYQSGGQIVNTGAPIAAGDSTRVYFYCDGDNNGMYSAGDSLLYIYTTGDGISAGLPHTFMANFFIQNASCGDTNMIFAIIPPDTNGGYCLCDTAFGNSNVILPLAWLTAKGKAMTEGNALHWKVGGQEGLNQYQVERWEGSWRSISPIITGSGSSFDWMDSSPGQKEEYRIRQNDVSGQISYSPIIQITRPEPLEEVLVWPVPARNILHVSQAESCDYRVLNAIGQQVSKGHIGDDPNWEMDISQLSAGNYFLELRKDGQRSIKKFVVE